MVLCRRDVFFAGCEGKPGETGDSHEWRSVKGFVGKKLPDGQGYAYELQYVALPQRDDEMCL